MTTLEGINEIMALCGHLPVPSLDTGGPSAAAMAEVCIVEAERHVQTQGWHYNTHKDLELTPDIVTSKIALPTGTLTIDSWGQSAWRDVSQVGGYLYDRDNNTDEFDDNLFVKVVLRFEFPCIPQPVQDYIVTVAAIRYATMRQMADVARSLEPKMFRMRAEARRFDGLSADVNLLNTPSAIRLTGDRNTYWTGTWAGASGGGA